MSFLLLLSWQPACKSAVPSQYDKLIISSSEKYYGIGADWRWQKGRIQQESRFNPKARNRTDPSGGAWGLGQILFGTAKEFGVNNPKQLFDPATNIDVMVHYSRILYDRFKFTQPTKDKEMLTDASYNWGIGNVLRFYRAARNTFELMAIHLPKVVRQYAKNVQKYKAEYLIGA